VLPPPELSYGNRKLRPADAGTQARRITPWMPALVGDASDRCRLLLWQRGARDGQRCTRRAAPEARALAGQLERRRVRLEGCDVWRAARGVQADRLSHPNRLHAHGCEGHADVPQVGAWNLERLQFHSPATLQSFALASFADARFVSTGDAGSLEVGAPPALPALPDAPRPPRPRPPRPLLHRGCAQAHRARCEACPPAAGLALGGQAGRQAALHMHGSQLLAAPQQTCRSPLPEKAVLWPAAHANSPATAPARCGRWPAAGPPRRRRAPCRGARPRTTADSARAPPRRPSSSTSSARWRRPACACPRAAPCPRASGTRPTGARPPGPAAECRAAPRGLARTRRPPRLRPPCLQPARGRGGDHGAAGTARACRPGGPEGAGGKWGPLRTATATVEEGAGVSVLSSSKVCGDLLCFVLTECQG